jgi:hypothetical protein
VEECLVFVDAELFDLVERSLLPEVGHDVHLARQDVADDGGVDIFLGLEELVAEHLGYFSQLGFVLVGNHVS